MGIRIHKVLGYGLFDLKTKKDKIVDNRINPNGFLSRMWEDSCDKWSIQGFIKFLENKMLNQKDVDRFHTAMLLDSLRESEKNDFYDCFVHNPEYGKKNILCIIPFSYIKSWYRNDDIIDYCESSLKKEPTQNSAKLLENGIYPYNGIYQDIKTGEIIEDWHVLKRGMSGLKDKHKNEIAKQMKIDTWEECLERIRPIVPLEIKLLCEYCEIFNDDKTTMTLLPMLYTYWS